MVFAMKCSYIYVVFILITHLELSQQKIALQSRDFSDKPSVISEVTIRFISPLLTRVQFYSPLGLTFQCLTRVQLYSPQVKHDQHRVCAIAAWDSSSHETESLNCVTEPEQRVYLTLQVHCIHNFSVYLALHIIYIAYIQRCTYHCIGTLHTIQRFKVYTI